MGQILVVMMRGQCWGQLWGKNTKEEKTQKVVVRVTLLTRRFTRCASCDSTSSAISQVRIQEEIKTSHADPLALLEKLKLKKLRFIKYVKAKYNKILKTSAMYVIKQKKIIHLG